MRIGELSRRSGVSRDTLRFYERQGLIQSEPGNDPTNTYRHYPEECLITLEMIAEAQAAGLSIADLSIFIGQLQAADAEDFDSEAFLQARIDEVEARIAQARRFLNTLRATKAALASDSFPEPE